jgi:hypothetical protein
METGENIRKNKDMPVKNIDKLKGRVNKVENDGYGYDAYVTDTGEIISNASVYSIVVWKKKPRRHPSWEINRDLIEGRVTDTYTSVGQYLMSKGYKYGYFKYLKITDFKKNKKLNFKKSIINAK